MYVGLLPSNLFFSICFTVSGPHSHPYIHRLLLTAMSNAIFVHVTVLWCLAFFLSYVFFYLSWCHSCLWERWGLALRCVCPHSGQLAPLRYSSAVFTSLIWLPMYQSYFWPVLPSAKFGSRGYALMSINEIVKASLGESPSQDSILWTPPDIITGRHEENARQTLYRSYWGKYQVTWHHSQLPDWHLSPLWMAGAGPHRLGLQAEDAQQRYYTSKQHWRHIVKNRHQTSHTSQTTSLQKTAKEKLTSSIHSKGKDKS